MPKMLQRRLADWLHFKYLRQPGSILDVGCAEGFALERFKEFGYDVCGIELYSQKPFIKKWDLNKGIPFNKQFDYVLLSFSLKYARNQRKFLFDVLKHLKKGGLLIVFDVKNIVLQVASEYPFQNLVCKKWNPVPLLWRFSRVAFEIPFPTPIEKYFLIAKKL
ncbi:MAG: methyltransferase domain-containing protein [Candidatus Norongarragalinales archaeon]